MKYTLFSLFIFLSFVFSSLEASPDMKTFLSEYYASPEKNKGYSKLLYAMEKNYREISIKLLNSGENPNCLPPNFTNATPFILAINREDEDLVSLMIQKGADINLPSFLPPKYPYIDRANIPPPSPLYIAVSENNQANIIRLLCLHGVRVRENRTILYQPLYAAAQKAEFEKFEAMADTLTDEEISLTDSLGKNLFTYASYGSQERKEDIMRICKYLLERKLSIETNNGSALSTAISVGNLELIHYFLSLGADINFRPTQPSYDPTPMFAAICYSRNDKKLDRFEPLKILLDLSADINFSYPQIINAAGNYYATGDYYYGRSPLSYAMQSKLNEAAQILINYGADVNYIDISEKSPLLRAIEANNLEGAKLLLAAGANLAGPYASKLIEVAYSKGFLELAKVLIEAESAMYD